MLVKGNKSREYVLRLGIAGALLLAVGLVANLASAQVVGVCANCHTMHNSQDGSAQVHVGAGAGWSGGSLSGGTSTAEQATLLKTDCVGCHTNASNSDTIVNIGANRVPIVYNTGSYPAQALAGGNFFNVAADGAYGHNVRGISSADGFLAFAPGDLDPELPGCTSSCHESLTLPDSTFNPSTPIGYRFNGCKGCHVNVAHHDSTDLSYRYLGGGGYFPHMDYVDGGGASPGPGQPNPYESSDWEQTASSTNHNFYKSQELTPSDDTIGSFCAGCHKAFHAMGTSLAPFSTIDNGGDDNLDGLISGNSGTNPWLRHPSGVYLPIADASGEYSVMSGAAYSPTIPVAQDLGANNPNAIDTGDQVMCLSCHRAHGSQYKDSLRFDYNAMNAHSYGTDQTGGCFYCHRNKDM